MRKPSTAAVKHWLNYLPSSGHLIWNHATGCVKKGSVAGYVNEKIGYRMIRMQGVAYLAHHLVWIWHGNKLVPTLEIEHK